MDHFKHLYRQLYIRVSIAVFGVGVSTIATFYICSEYLELEPLFSALASLGVVTIFGGIASSWLTDTALGPIGTVWQAVLHVDPDRQGTPAPNIDSLKIGKQLVHNLTMQIYQFASQQDSQDLINHRKEIIQATSVVSRLPLPLFVFNKDLLVTNASVAGIEYSGVESSKLFGKPIFDNLNLEFQSDNTLESWMQSCQDNKVTDTGFWERVRVRLPDDTIRQCDMSAFYNRDNPSGADFIVTLFDRTKQYTEDDDNLSFVALAVHELRTPLTMLRGYIEVFEEDVMPSLNAELQDYLLKMQASANQLTAFVHNILNVARIDSNQLALHLSEESWSEVLENGLIDMRLRAQILGKEIEVSIEPDLPKVGVDRVSIYEVINNLLDNALKYGPDSKKIIINSRLNQEGMIETTVQDFGVGIPESVLPNLFERFYRNHRTRTDIGGTGLGLYLSKALINAHGGQIWANSKVDEGSTFGFTVQPYDKLSDGMKDAKEGEVVRQANGWIKNHSFYRR